MNIYNFDILCIIIFIINTRLINKTISYEVVNKNIHYFIAFLLNCINSQKRKYKENLNKN